MPARAIGLNILNIRDILRQTIIFLCFDWGCKDTVFFPSLKYYFYIDNQTPIGHTHF